jgi:hypothetical protein
MDSLQAIKDRLPAYAKDVKLNLDAVLFRGSLAPAEALGAALAAAFAACNVAMLKASVLGMPYPLCAVLVLLYAAVAAPSPRDEEPPGEAGSDARMVGAGLIAALAAMTHYLFFFFAPIVGLQAASSRRRRGRAAFLFLVGFVVLLLPWIMRTLIEFTTAVIEKIPQMVS